MIFRQQAIIVLSCFITVRLPDTGSIQNEVETQDMRYSIMKKKPR